MFLFVNASSVTCFSSALSVALQLQVELAEQKHQNDLEQLSLGTEVRAPSHQALFKRFWANFARFVASTLVFFSPTLLARLPGHTHVTHTTIVSFVSHSGGIANFVDTGSFAPTNAFSKSRG